MFGAFLFGLPPESWDFCYHTNPACFLQLCSGRTAKGKALGFSSLPGSQLLQVEGTLTSFTQAAATPAAATLGWLLGTGSKRTEKKGGWGNNCFPSL